MVSERERKGEVKLYFPVVNNTWLSKDKNVTFWCKICQLPDVAYCSQYERKLSGVPGWYYRLPEEPHVSSELRR